MTSQLMTSSADDVLVTVLLRLIASDSVSCHDRSLFASEKIEIRSTWSGSTDEDRCFANDDMIFKDHLTKSKLKKALLFLPRDVF